MGEVVDMRAFGRGYGTAGLGAGEAAATPDAGAPAPPQNATDVATDLEQALTYARTATNRLVNLPAPGAVDPTELKQLLATFADLENQIRTVVDRLQQGPTDATLRDASLVQQNAMGYVDAVETALQKAGVAAGAATPALASSGGKKVNWWLWGALGLGVGVAGFAIYKASTAGGEASGTRHRPKPRKVRGVE